MTCTANGQPLIRQTEPEQIGPEAWARVGNPRNNETYNGTRPYLLPGPVIVDAWGRELLYQTGTDGQVKLTSAGPDGYFVWAPSGLGNTLVTAANATSAAAGDQAAFTDNLTVNEAGK
jgi:hypothetical protein